MSLVVKENLVTNLDIDLFAHLYQENKGYLSRKIYYILYSKHRGPSRRHHLIRKRNLILPNLILKYSTMILGSMIGMVLSTAKLSIRESLME